MLLERSGVVHRRGDLVATLQIVSITRWSQQGTRSWKANWMAHRSIKGHTDSPRPELEVRGRGYTVDVEGRDREFDTIPDVQTP